MKKFNVNKLAVIAFGICLSLPAHSQEPKPVADVLIVIKKKNKKKDFLMTCVKGCYWDKLAFSIKEGEVKAIDQFGMAILPTEAYNPDDLRGDFLFTVSLTRETIIHDYTKWVLYKPRRKQIGYEFVGVKGIPTSRRVYEKSIAMFARGSQDVRKSLKMLKDKHA